MAMRGSCLRLARWGVVGLEAWQYCGVWILLVVLSSRRSLLSVAALPSSMAWNKDFLGIWRGREEE